MFVCEKESLSLTIIAVMEISIKFADLGKNYG